MCVGDRICLYLSSEVIFGDLRYPVPLLGVLLMSIKASGSPAHPDSFFVVLPPKTTQETTFRGAEGPVESFGVGASAGRKPTAIYKNIDENIVFCLPVVKRVARQLAVTGAYHMYHAPTGSRVGSWTPCSALVRSIGTYEQAGPTFSYLIAVPLIRSLVCLATDCAVVPVRRLDKAH